MPTYSADQAQLAFVAETAQGVPDVNPSMYVARFGSESLSLDVTTSESIELNPARGVTDAILAGASAGGSIECELVSSDGFDALFSGVHGDAWATDDLDVGNTMQTFSFEKMFTDGVTPYYQAFFGVSASSYTLSIAPNSPVTLSWGLVGGLMKDPAGGVDLGTGNRTAETQTLSSSPVMTASRSTTVWGGGANGVCITALDLTVDSQNRGIQCISDFGDKEVALGKLKVTGSAQVYFTNNAIADEFLSATPQTLTVTCADRDVGSGQKSYSWEMTRVKWTAGGSPPIEGTGTDIIYPMEFEALVDEAQTPDRSIRLVRAETP